MPCRIWSTHNFSRQQHIKNKLINSLPPKKKKKFWYFPQLSLLTTDKIKKLSHLISSKSYRSPSPLNKTQNSYFLSSINLFPPNLLFSLPMSSGTTLRPALFRWVKEMRKKLLFIIIIFIEIGQSHHLSVWQNTWLKSESVKIKSFIIHIST